MSPRQLTINFTDLDVPSPAKPVAPRREADEAAGDKRLFYISLSSGSSGNACYIGTAEEGIVIDAGIRADLIEDGLEANGIPMSRVKALLLTHDHSDHVRYAYALLRQNKHITLMCTNRVMNGLLRRHSISRRIKDYHRAIFKEIPFTAAGFEITAFDVPHDGSDNMGFSIERFGRRIVVATDLGEVQERARYYMEGANYLVIEANYDSDMLRLGRYPEYLKARIRAANGHMDNAETARYLASLGPLGNLRYVFLCHLSEDNNTPAKARGAVASALEGAGCAVASAEASEMQAEGAIRLMALPRREPSPLFVFRK